MKNKNKFRKLDVHKFVPKSGSKGTPPGTVQYIGRPRVEASKIDLIEYNESYVAEYEINQPEELKKFLQNDYIKWIRVTGVHDIALIDQLGEIFDINQLELEDISNTSQRPRLEERENYLFMIFKLLILNPEDNDVAIEQVSLVLGKNFVLSFHETEPVQFELLRSRILAKKGRVRKMKSDYLAFTLADVMIDQYFYVLEDIGDVVESVESELILNPGSANQEIIYRIKRRLVYVNRTIWPVRELINAIERSDHVLIHQESRIYFRNIYDHSVQIIESLDSLRDLTSSMMDLYLSSVSVKLNEIMKVLTIFSALFIPLTFFAGVYGMNFKNFPEIHWVWGYPLFWLVCVIVTIVMLFYFKRRKWM
ncbi:MAG TPA: magnesium/cobalt transporter CorA [Prolixibacteraceae bacterium]|nr:magnesium/cobalt transporter CorA [Prolixibacteraceae bacterium]